MSRTRVLIGCVLALLTAAAITGCGSSKSSGGSHLTVSPSAVQTSSQIRFGFTAPAATSQTTSYSLSVTGPAGPGCVGAHEANGPSVAKGATATITVGPSQFGKLWCAGYYTARVLELKRASCTSGKRCSQAVRVAGTVATGHFTVKRG